MLQQRAAFLKKVKVSYTFGKLIVWAHCLSLEMKVTCNTAKPPEITMK